MKNAILFILLAVTLNSFAQRPRQEKSPVFNWGIKTGLESLSMTHYNVFSNETELSNAAYKNQSGFYINTFFRVNLKRVFLQPGVEWSRYDQDFSFDLLSEENVNISTRSQNTNINALIGYNIVKNGPFLLNLLAGPSFCFNYKNKYDLSPEISLLERKSHTYTYGIIGFSINIARIHFDIRYKLNVFDTDIHFDEMPDRPEMLDGIVIRKNANVLGFACGVLF